MTKGFEGGSSKKRAERVESPLSEGGLETFAADSKMKLEELVKNSPELDITPDEIEDSVTEHVEMGRDKGISVLADGVKELEGVDISSFADDPDGIIKCLGVLAAYLKLVEESEDQLDLERF